MIGSFLPKPTGQAASWEEIDAHWEELDKTPEEKEAERIAATTKRTEEIPQSDDDPKLTRIRKQSEAVIHNLGVDYPHIFEAIKVTSKFVDETIKQSDIAPVAKILEEGSRKAARGAEMWATGADIYNPITEQQIGTLPDLDVDPAAARFIGSTTFGAATESVLLKSLSVLDKIKVDFPTGGGQQLIPVGVTNQIDNVVSKVDDLPSTAQPLRLQKDLVPSQTLRNIPIGSTSTDIAKQLPSKYYNQLNKKYRYITKGKLSKDKSLLGTLRGREETIDTLWTKLQKLEAEKVELKKLSKKLSLTELKKLDYNLYRKIKLNKKYIKETSKDIQDTAAYNIFGTDKRIYMTEAVRNKLKKELTEFSGGDEWHHIFNSKDAGEYMLTEVAQDPLIAANLFQHMKKLKLDSSGIASNLALMRKVPHGKWHKLMKDMNVEPSGFIKDLNRWKRAELSLAEYGNDIAAAVKAGKTDVNELFTLLEKYKLFQDELSKELFTKYGAKKFSDIPGVNEIIESHSFKTATGK